MATAKPRFANPYPQGIYLDNNASMMLLPAVKAAIVRAVTVDESPLANPSSIHARGQCGKQKLFECKRELSEWLGTKEPDEWITTSGATEAINTVLQSFAGAAIAYSAVDHSSVVESVSGVPAQLWPLRVDRRGEILEADIEQFIASAALAERVLLAWQVANNETGICFPLSTLARMVAALNPPGQPQKLFVLLDGAQALGKLDDAHLRQALHYADYLALSAHKIGGPTGIGALWIRPGSPFKPLLTGGNQEKRRRSGTHNTLGILGFTAAVRDWRQNGAQYRAHMEGMRARLLDNLSAIRGFTWHRGNLHLSNTVNFHFDECRDESLVLALDLEGFYVSSGSACNSGSLKPSRVLSAMGYSDEQALSSLRVCVGPSTAQHEVDLFCERIAHRVRHIRESRARMDAVLPEMRASL